MLVALILAFMAVLFGYAGHVQFNVVLARQEFTLMIVSRSILESIMVAAFMFVSFISFIGLLYHLGLPVL